MAVSAAQGTSTGDLLVQLHSLHTKPQSRGSRNLPSCHDCRHQALNPLPWEELLCAHRDCLGDSFLLFFSWQFTLYMMEQKKGDQGDKSWSMLALIQIS